MFMKVNFYEAFEFIDEEATEILAEYDNNTLATMQYSPDVTIREVLGKKKHIHTKQKKKLNMKLRLLVAAIIILAVSSVSYATYRGNLKENGGAEIIDDNNRKWIGTIFEREATVTDAKGKVKDKKSNQFSEQYDWKSSSVIKSIQSGAPIPQTVNEFLTKSEKKYI